MGNSIFFWNRFVQLIHGVFDPVELVTIFTELRKCHDMRKNLNTIHLYWKCLFSKFNGNKVGICRIFGFSIRKFSYLKELRKNIEC